MITQTIRYGAWQAGLDAGFTPQALRLATKMLRRYQLQGNPFSARGFLHETETARLAIAMSLVMFFTKLNSPTREPETVFGGLHSPAEWL